MPTEQLIPREQVLKRMNISDSTERRMRQSGEDWPAHIRVGQRILYRESGVNAWIASQEQNNRAASGECGPGLRPELDAALDGRARELAAQAPPLSTRQTTKLREILSHPKGGRER